MVEQSSLSEETGGEVRKLSACFPFRQAGMAFDNRIPIHQVHQFRCAKARATAAGYAMTPVNRAERETPLRVSGCPRYGDDSRNDNGTPVQPQSERDKRHFDREAVAGNGGGCERTS